MGEGLKRAFAAARATRAAPEIISDARISDMMIWQRMKEEFRATDVRRELSWTGFSENDRVADRMMQRWRKLGWAAPSPTNKRVWHKY